ncbi:MAG: hypothetical protein QJR08_10120 [Bacillota bacterium]|nr:hypothetical protein [Bacillota bacterium]
MDAVYGALVLITFAMALGALLGTGAGGRTPPSVGALQALAGRRVRVEREVATWSWAGGGGEMLHARDMFEGELADVRLDGEGRELVLEFACEDMDRAIRVCEPQVDVIGSAVAAGSGDGDLMVRIWPAGPGGEGAGRAG